MADVDSACRARSPSERRRIRCAGDSGSRARELKTPQCRTCARRSRGCRAFAQGELTGRRRAPSSETALVKTPRHATHPEKLKIIVTIALTRGFQPLAKYARCLSCPQPHYWDMLRL